MGELPSNTKLSSPMVMLYCPTESVEVLMLCGKNLFMLALKQEELQPQPCQYKKKINYPRKKVEALLSEDRFSVKVHEELMKVVSKLMPTEFPKNIKEVHGVGVSSFFLNVCDFTLIFFDDQVTLVPYSTKKTWQFLTEKTAVDENDLKHSFL